MLSASGDAIYVSRSLIFTLLNAPTLISSSYFLCSRKEPFIGVGIHSIMPPDRGRASRACVSCRKQKTRCYEPSVLGKACLRCERLRQKCSLTEASGQRDDGNLAIPHPNTDARYELNSSAPRVKVPRIENIDILI
jgi:hypothetical protein